MFFTKKSEKAKEFIALLKELGLGSLDYNHNKKKDIFEFIQSGFKAGKNVSIDLKNKTVAYQKNHVDFEKALPFKLKIAENGTCFITINFNGESLEIIDFDNKKGNEQLALTLKKINEFLLERPLESTTEIENEYKFSDKQLWMLSITAIYRTYEESYEFNTLQDKLATSLTRGVSKEKLKNQWNIHNKEDLMAEIKALEKKESVEEFGEAYMIWDYARIFMLVRLAFDLKWINEQEFWQLLTTYAPEIQQSYNGWEEMATAFLQARKLWAGSEITQQNEFEKLIEKLLNNPSSVWNNVSWNTDLTT